MEYITIQKDKNLKTITDFLQKTPESFIFSTLNYLNINDWIADSSDEWGKTLGEILDEENVDSLGVAILALKTNHTTVVEAFRNLNIICSDNFLIDEQDNTEYVDNYNCDHYENYRLNM